MAREPPTVRIQDALRSTILRVDQRAKTLVLRDALVSSEKGRRLVLGRVGSGLLHGYSYCPDPGYLPINRLICGAEVQELQSTTSGCTDMEKPVNKLRKCLIGRTNWSQFTPIET